MGGQLYVMSVPIGHPEDVTVRALRLFHQLPLVAAKDPAATRRLFEYYGIATPLTTYSPVKVPLLVAWLEDGRDLGLVSDGGTPLISDPGSFLVQAAVDRGLGVSPAPGASALLAAVVSAGVSADAFVFAGLLPGGAARQRKVVEAWRHESRTIVAFLPAVALPDTLRSLQRILGDRSIVLACDLTCPSERIIRDSLALLAQHPERLPGTTQQVTLVIPGGKISRVPQRVRSDRAS